MTTADLNVAQVLEFVFDPSRKMLWQFDAAVGTYGLVASGGLAGYPRRTLSDLQGLTDTALVPLCVDPRIDEQEPGARIDSAAIGLEALSKAVAAHLDRLGVARTDWARVAKVAEEGGEVLGALLKRDECRTTTGDVLDELGDVFLAALAACDQLGVDPSVVVTQRWDTVSKRTPVTANGAVVGEGR